MYVPSAYVRCPSCGSTFQAETSVTPSDNAAQKARSGVDPGRERGAKVAPASVLHTWKDIAAYLGRGVRTAQRWEHDLRMPVHRPSRQKPGSVLAFPEEISRWLHQTPVALTREAVVGSIRITTQPRGRPARQQCA
jgi:hypothetical protein